MNETRGKCPSCRKVYRWSGKPLLRDARCPVHGTRLKRASHLLEWPLGEFRPVALEASK